jgi:tetratricopeptide (TPR) repeat protein
MDNYSADEQINSIVESALLCLNSGNFDEALTKLDPLIQFNNTPENIHLIRGMIYMAKGSTEQAFNSFSCELVLYPHNSKSKELKEILLSDPTSKGFPVDGLEFQSSSGLSTVSVIQKGVELFDQEQWLEASEYFNAVSKSYPWVNGLNYASMVCSVNRQKYPEAVCYAGKELLIELHKEAVSLLQSILTNKLAPIVFDEGFRK